MAKFAMGSLVKQAQQLQEKLSEVQEELGKLEIEGSAGGGMVSAKVNGHKELLAIRVDREVVDPDDVEMLEDLIVAAVNQAMSNAEVVASQEMQKVTGGMIPGGLGGKIPGLGI